MVFAIVAAVVGEHLTLLCSFTVVDKKVVLGHNGFLLLLHIVLMCW